MMKLLLNIVIIIGIIAQNVLTKSSLFHCFFFSIFQYVKSRQRNQQYLFSVQKALEKEDYQKYPYSKPKNFRFYKKQKNEVTHVKNQPEYFKNKHVTRPHNFCCYEQFSLETCKTKQYRTDAFRTQPNIYDAAFAKIFNSFQSLNIFAKHPSQIFGWTRNRPTLSRHSPFKTYKLTFLLLKQSTFHCSFSICSANQLTHFYIMGTLVVNGLVAAVRRCFFKQVFFKKIPTQVFSCEY